MKTIYIGGGCFWGLQKYIQLLGSKVQSEVGYAQGNKKHVTYEQVCTNMYDFVEVVCVSYDETQISLYELLKYAFNVIDPTSLNAQKNDRGRQYRSGIYYTCETDIPTIQHFLDELQTQYTKKVVVEYEKVHNYVTAETYHQNYLDKNPNGYCHIDFGSLK